MSEIHESVKKRCPRCGGRLFDDNGEPFCLQCGTLRVNPVGTTQAEGRPPTELPKEPFAELESLAAVYGLSPRRLYDHIRAGRVLGIIYDSGRFLTFDGKHITEVKYIIGPVSDVRSEYIMPKGTTGVAAEFISGAISGRIYQGEFNPHWAQPSKVQLWAELGCSGVIVCAQPFKA